MIISKGVNMRITNINKKMYTNLGYDTTNEYVFVKIEDLSKNSHYEILVKCDICGQEKKLMYSKYNKNTKSETVYYSCSQKCSSQKKLDYYIEKYGVRNPSQLDEIKEKQKNTNIEKYGTVSALQNKNVMDKTIKTRRITNPHYNMIENKKPYRLYKNSVIRETRKHKKQLYDEWDGFDFYDNEYILPYKSLKHYDRFSPTIDHKTSVFYGYNNGISPEIIGNINNLCVTKRWINSSKSRHNEYKKP